MADQLKFGWEAGAKPTAPILMADSQQFKAKSGRFITINTSGLGVIAGAATTRYDGFVEAGDEDTGVGQNAVFTNILPNLTDRFSIPINSVTGFSQVQVNRKIDITVVSDIQGVNFDAGVIGALIVVSQHPDNTQFVIVKYNPEVLAGYLAVT